MMCSLALVKQTLDISESRQSQRPKMHFQGITGMREIEIDRERSQFAKLIIQVREEDVDDIRASSLRVYRGFDRN